MTELLDVLSVETATLVAEVVASALALGIGVVAELSAARTFAAHEVVLGGWFAFVGVVALYIATQLGAEVWTRVRDGHVTE